MALARSTGTYAQALNYGRTADETSYKIEKNGDIYVLRCIKNDYKDQIKFIGKNYEHVMVEHNACLSRITNIEQKKESWKLEKNNELDSLLNNLNINAIQSAPSTTSSSVQVVAEKTLEEVEADKREAAKKTGNYIDLTGGKKKLRNRK